MGSRPSVPGSPPCWVWPGRPARPRCPRPRCYRAFHSSARLVVRGRRCLNSARNGTWRVVYAVRPSMSPRASGRDERRVHLPCRSGETIRAGVVVVPTSEAVLYVVAFGLAGAVISMLVQQTVGGTIEGSRVLLTSVL